ncbi:MAG: tetratricopeptide repeat protein [Myxococcaceae bacterium]
MIRRALLGLVVLLPAISLAGPLEDEIHRKRAEQLHIGSQLGAAEPALLFRMAELYWEEARYFLLQHDDAASEQSAKAAVALLSQLLERFPTWDRADEALYSLGQGLLDTGDDQRAQLAFKRLVDRHPQSALAPVASLRLGQYLLAKSNGRADWLQRAAEKLTVAARNPALKTEATLALGHCQLGLLAFEDALTSFEAVAKSDATRRAEARAAFVRTWVRSGQGTTGVRTAFTRLSDSVADRRVLEHQLADRFHADGFDKEAAVVWQALITEDPKTGEAFGDQVSIVDAVMRAGRRQVTLQQARKLADFAPLASTADLERGEKLISSLAVAWHQECRKTHEDSCLDAPRELYEVYLKLWPQTARAYELRFFLAELLFAEQEFQQAAASYRQVVDHDIACRQSGRCAAGRFFEAAALSEIQAREQANR